MCVFLIPFFLFFVKVAQPHFLNHHHVFLNCGPQLTAYNAWRVLIKTHIIHIVHLSIIPNKGSTAKFGYYTYIRAHLAVSSGRLRICFQITLGGGTDNFPLAIVVHPAQAPNVPRNRSDHEAGAQPAHHHKHTKRAYPEKPSGGTEEGTASGHHSVFQG